jgi:cytochrome b561
MRWKSTEDRYGVVAITFHWLSACTLLLLCVSGFWMANTESTEMKLILIRTHAFFGVATLTLTLLRLLWRAIDRRPTQVSGRRRWHERAARLVHGLMYLLILVLAASGLGMLFVSEAGDTITGTSHELLPNFSAIPPHAPHVFAVRLLIASFSLHVFAALYHQFIIRDRILARIGL